MAKNVQDYEMGSGLVSNGAASPNNKYEAKVSVPVVTKGSANDAVPSTAEITESAGLLGMRVNDGALEVADAGVWNAVGGGGVLGGNGLGPSIPLDATCYINISNLNSPTGWYIVEFNSLGYAAGTQYTYALVQIPVALITTKPLGVGSAVAGAPDSTSALYKEITGAVVVSDVSGTNIGATLSTYPSGSISIKLVDRNHTTEVTTSRCATSIRHVL